MGYHLAYDEILFINELIRRFTWPIRPEQRINHLSNVHAGNTG